MGDRIRKKPALRVDIRRPLRDLRKEKSLSRREMAEELGVGERTILMWEEKSAPPWARLVLAAYVFKLPPWPPK